MVPWTPQRPIFATDSQGRIVEEGCENCHFVIAMELLSVEIMNDVVILLLLCFYLVVQMTFSSASVLFPLSGDDWILTGPNNTHVSASVPIGVYTDLLRNKIIEDPYYRMNDVSLQWIGRSNWTYTKNFKITETFMKYKEIRLLCDGLDTVAEVLLNNVVIAKVNNMFNRYVIDVTKVLKVGSNTMQVIFQSPVTYALNEAKLYPYIVPPECPPPVQSGECHVNFIRKESASFSWDWGPAFPSTGIWRNITLEAYNTGVIRYITTEMDFDEGFWNLAVIVFFETMPNVNGFLHITIPDLNADYQQWVIMPTNDSEIYADMLLNGSVIKEWWPNGLGEQILYRTVVEFNTSDGDFDHREIKIGFRTIELVQDVLAGQELGYTFYFKINDVPVFMKGSNWIPADSFQERITSSYLRQLLTSAAEANMNMLRVWGGGVYESDEFYDLADELGILIWQDLMFACALYPVNDEFISSVQEELTYQVRRLKYHPSIAIWSGNNENEESLSENWYNLPQSEFERYKADYEKLYIDTIRVLILYENPTRPFVTSSPSNGIETMEEGWVTKDPQSTIYGDIHYYMYANDSWNWRNYPMPRFASEFGLESWCSLETLMPVSVSLDWDIDSDFVSHRQHHGEGNEEMMKQIGFNLNPPNSVNRTQRFIDFIYLSQINQAIGMKTEVEFYRRSQILLADGHGFTMSALYWQLNDIWQGPSWASIEYGGKWKMLHYYAKKFYSRTMVSAFEEDGLLKIYYINDDAFMTNNYINDDAFMMNNYINDDASMMNNYINDDAFMTNNVDKNHKQRSSDIDRRRMKESFGRGRDGRKDETIEREENNIYLIIDCFHWESLDIQMSWNMTFEKSLHSVEFVFISRLTDLFSECQCVDSSRCFFRFSGFLSDKSPAFPDNHFFPTSFSAANGLKRANVKIIGIDPFNSTLVQISLSTDAIAPYTWLEANGHQGHFSDNGFLMSTPKLTVNYTAYNAITDWKNFLLNLNIKTLADVNA